METFDSTWQDAEPLLFITCIEAWHSYTHHRFVSVSLRFLRRSVYEITSGLKSCIPLYSGPLRIPQPSPIITRNPPPARNCNSRFPPLFSAQIPISRRKKIQNPASHQTYWGTLNVERFNCQVSNAFEQFKFVQNYVGGVIIFLGISSNQTRAMNQRFLCTLNTHSCFSLL